MFNSLNLSWPLHVSQGEGPHASGPSWLPGGAGHPAAVGGWRSSAADHKPGLELCLWPVSLTLRGARWFRYLAPAGTPLRSNVYILAPVAVAPHF